ncbi:TatD family deoxyribonuclease [Candidatus Saccharibacteria bacterium]|nr:TatD family deoxyribonuclease [Candidatus Saccharibacteria bacterium]
MFDTHCHIQDSEFYTPHQGEAVYVAAKEAAVKQMIVVGCDLRSSEEAVKFAATHESVYAAVGVHPHETSKGIDGIAGLIDSSREHVTSRPLIVAIGEIGLDYFYTHSPREIQIAALEKQLQLATDLNLAVSFHVREAFSDFWPILNNFSGVRGVLHSFTDTKETLDKALARGLYIGVNGISTFTKDARQREMFDAVPLERLLLETDAPFLAPHPYRGKPNQPAYVGEVARYHAARRLVDREQFIARTTANAEALFLT